MSKEDSELEIGTKKTIEARGIRIGRYIGSGSYSKVYCAVNPEKMEIALKVIEMKAKSDYIQRFLPREVEIVRRLNHPNIARIYKVYFLEGPKVTVFEGEFCANGDLLDRIKRNKQLTEVEARPFFRQLIEAMKYLEAHDIVHRDLKCENVFLDRFDNVKLGDFGFSRVLKKGEKSDTFCGSKIYVAPEILRGQKYGGNAVDIWSMGIVLYIMVTGVMPYDEGNLQKMVERQMTHMVRLDYNEMITSEWLKETPYKMSNEKTGNNGTPAVQFVQPKFRMLKDAPLC
ncbi:unnamed protein product, partial [Mesorhabditis spiculigera]